MKKFLILFFAASLSLMLLGCAEQAAPPSGDFSETEEINTEKELCCGQDETEVEGKELCCGQDEIEVEKKEPINVPIVDVSEGETPPSTEISSSYFDFKITTCMNYDEVQEILGEADEIIPNEFLGIFYAFYSDMNIIFFEDETIFVIGLFEYDSLKYGDRVTKEDIALLFGDGIAYRADYQVAEELDEEKYFNVIYKEEGSENYLHFNIEGGLIEYIQYTQWDGGEL